MMAERKNRLGFFYTHSKCMERSWIGELPPALEREAAHLSRISPCTLSAYRRSRDGSCVLPSFAGGLTRPTHRRSFAPLRMTSQSLVRRAHRRAPVAVAVAGQFDLPRLAAHRAILHVRLPAPAAVFEVELRRLAAVGTQDRDELAHVNQLS